MHVFQTVLTKAMAIVENIIKRTRGGALGDAAAHSLESGPTPELQQQEAERHNQALREAIAAAGGQAFGTQFEKSVWVELKTQMDNALAGQLDKDKAAPRPFTVRWYQVKGDEAVAHGSNVTVRQACYFIAHHKLVSNSTVKGVDMLCRFMHQAGLLRLDNIIPM